MPCAPREIRALLAAAVASALVAPATARAGEGGVVIFDGPPPPPKALARILWPEQAPAAAPRTRSIRLLDEAQGTGAAEAGPEAFALLVRFRSDSADILPESPPYLDSVGAMLRLPEAEGRRVAAVGHADATGPDDYNQQLSERRAAAVAAYLRRQHGATPDRLAAAGRGERDPLPGLEPTAARNRRVEFRAADG